MYHNQSEKTLNEYLTDFFEVSSCYRGQGKSMSVGRGLALLHPITQQSLCPKLAQKARLLSIRIVIGRRGEENDCA